MRVLLADDHSLFRDGMKSLLRSRRYEVVGEARNGEEAVEATRRLRPDIVLMDLAMPVLDGLSATRLISAEMPQVKVVIVTASEEDANLFEAIKSGAKGYLMKDLKADVFFALLDGVEKDQPALTPALARKLLQELSHPHAKPRSEDPDALTDREQEVLELLVQGVTSNKKLADRLGVSENTIKFHMRNILEKLHLHNRAEVIAFAARRGVVPPEGHAR